MVSVWLVRNESERMSLKLKLRLVQFRRAVLEQAAEEITRFLIFAFQIISVGDFNLRLQDDLFVVVHVVQLQLERGGHDGVKLGDGQGIDAHLAIDQPPGAAELPARWRPRDKAASIGRKSAGL